LALELRIEEDSPEMEEFSGLFAKAVALAKPKILFFDTVITGRGAGWLSLGAGRFHSRVLVEKTLGIERVYPFMITCGHELDEIDFDRNDILQPFWHDFLKERIFDQAAEHFRRLISPYLDGKNQAVLYPADEKIWPHRDLRLLYNIFPDEAIKRIGVKLNESNLMSPNKSSCGIVFGVDYDFCSCDLCDRHNCPRSLRSCGQGAGRPYGTQTALPRP